MLRELLRAGHEATCFSRTAPRVKGVRFITGDVTNIEDIEKACDGHDAIIHLAAVPGPGRATIEKMLHVNVVATGLVLEAAVKSGISKVVFASSGAASPTCSSPPRRTRAAPRCSSAPRRTRKSISSSMPAKGESTIF